VHILNCNPPETEEEKEMKRKEVEAFIPPYQGLHWLPFVTPEEYETSIVVV